MFWRKKKESDVEKPAALAASASSGSSSDGISEKKSQSEKKPKLSIKKKKNAGSKKADGKDAAQDPLAHLPEHEQAILRQQLDMPDIKVTIGMIYRYATRNDLMILVVSFLTAIVAGAAMPFMTIIFGSLAGTFQSFFLGTLTGDAFSSKLATFTLYFLYIGIVSFVTTYISTAGFIYTGDHITQKIREHYMAAILRQNIGFFDKLGAGEIATRITSDTQQIQEGISEKVGLSVTYLSAFITAFIIGFVKYWLLTLILCSTVVAIVFTMGGLGSQITKFTRASINAYALGGTVAEEVISSIRNATAFGTQDKLARQYDAHLIEAEKWGFRQKSLLGSMLGFMMFIIYSNYALAFWQGSRFLAEHKGGVGLSDILTILLAIMIGAFSLGNMAPNVQAFTTGLAAASKIFTTIDRISPMDPTTDAGIEIENVRGDIELKNVRHIYPSRPEVVVMEDVSLFVPAAKTTALVGPSGSGKSTIVGLVERFYDPVGGKVFLDGQDVRDLNLHSLRRNISLVSQEPTLFGTTIFGNIAHGLIGTMYENIEGDKKWQMVTDAAKMANAHDFILGLPEGYETNVGERGFLMSGGQKQRIAIARAVISDPKILLLDEATSALDTKSEGVVQAALDKAAQGRTTIIIAHRLSTIKGADNIVVMTEGKIVEQGTHDELLSREGAYHGLVEAQQIAQRKKEEAKEAEEDSEEVDEAPDSMIKASRTKSYRQGDADLERVDTTKSQSSALARKAAEENKQKYGLWTLIKLIASFNRKEMAVMFFGLGCSIIAGGGHPTQAVFFAKCIVSLALPESQYGKMRSDINFWSGMYFMLAWAQLLSYLGQGIAFAYCSEKLIHRVRDRSFRTMLRQDIGFFDKEENAAGALTSFLSTETTHVAGLSGTTLGTILNVVTTLIASMVLALAIGWKLALVCIATIPILLFCGFLRFRMLANFQAKAKRAYEKSASYASENVSAIRTVASLTREQDVWDEYHRQLVATAKKNLYSNLKSSALYAASQSLMFLCLALGFWYGGTLIGSGEYGLQQFFICLTAVIFGAQSAGTIFSFAPDMGKAKHSAGELKTLFDRKPPIDTWSNDGSKVGAVDGEIHFSNVHFRYPTRPEQPVLRGLDLTIKPGQYAALVGPSGCGKSTTIGLTERFYDPLSGTITVDGQDISTLNLNEYRNHIALVSQEPTLYQGTIRENVLLGSDRGEASDEDVIQACKDANIYNFITSLPDGFSTVVGNKGVMLSGGQKQRVAIARALLRNPKILLLDEATSALDSESEKIVQAALDHAAKGRTTIAVAHRLSTIQNADVIYVFDNGRIVEQGTHNELMNKAGKYFELVELQSLEKNA